MVSPGSFLGFHVSLGTGKRKLCGHQLLNAGARNAGRDQVNPEGGVWGGLGFPEV